MCRDTSATMEAERRAEDAKLLTLTMEERTMSQRRQVVSRSEKRQADKLFPGTSRRNTALPTP